MSAPLALVLTGPTGSGKSAWALQLAQQLPVEIISVDSAQVYRGLDIGTAKPTAAVRARVPHHLVDIRDPAQRYSAGDFARDARAAIEGVHARGRLPVLVGGTLLYLRALVRGIAPLPAASPALRAQLEQEAATRGWAALHAELLRLDPRAGAKIHVNDPQRIQRALEVYRLSGRTISDWQAAAAAPPEDIRWLQFALIPADRAAQARALAARFESMLEAGLLAEVSALYQRGDLDAELPSIRSVGYRQLWAHCAGETSLQEAVRQAITATRQLAKRQLTWLRSERAYQALEPADPGGIALILRAIAASGFVA
ncbi:MAG: tRNA (adenosine(37)-N6)-dimethylallyltransferase MiaA [Proteobacteria bacterium]|nr:tRNA (adenosine(37)-N6)-dimethylallyltransferase MiaA [Pseudomonadota bacterium]